MACSLDLQTVVLLKQFWSLLLPSFGYISPQLGGISLGYINEHFAGSLDLQTVVLLERIGDISPQPGGISQGYSFEHFGGSLDPQTLLLMAQFWRHFSQILEIFLRTCIDWIPF